MIYKINNTKIDAEVLSEVLFINMLHKTMFSGVHFYLQKQYNTF